MTTNSGGGRYFLPLFLLLLAATPFIFWDQVVYHLGFDILETTATVARYMLGIVVWLLLAHVANRLIGTLIWDGLFEQRLRRPIPKLLRDIVAILVYVAAVAGIIGVVFQKSLTLLAAATGGAGVIIGLAIRDMIADVFSGLALSIERPFKLGDFVKLESGVEGEVVGMNWRATHLRTTNNDIVVIPNNVLAGKVIINHHKAGNYFRVDLEMWLDFSVPPERALRILNAAVKSAQNEIAAADHEYPNPISGGDLDSDAIAIDIKEFGIKYRLRFWLLRYGNWSVTRNRVITSVMAHLQRAGISPAYPQQDLFITSMPERRTDEETIRLQMLGNVGIFTSFTPEELTVLARTLTKRVVKPGTTIIKRGEPGDSLYIIGEGLVAVHIWVEAQQKEVRVSQMISGQFFGEVALLTGEPRTATIVAVTEVLLYEVTRDHLMELLHNRPEIAEQMSKIVGEHRLRDMENIGRLTPEQQAKEKHNLVQQMLSKVKKLFGLK